MSDNAPPPPPYGGPPPGPGGPGYGGPPPGYGYPAPPPPGVYAEWGQRAIALLWDVVYTLPAWLLQIVGAILLVVGIVLEDGGDGDGTAVILVGVLLILVGIVVGIVLTVRNLILRQGRTGYTWGKSKVGIRVVRELDGQPCGVGSAVGRFFLHWAINQAFYIDYLWPLWDDRNQTLTDKVLGTVVINQPER